MCDCFQQCSINRCRFRVRKSMELVDLVWAEDTSSMRGEGSSSEESTFVGEGDGAKRKRLHQIAAEVRVMATELQRLRHQGVEQEAALQREVGEKQVAEASARHLAELLEKTQKSLQGPQLDSRTSSNVAGLSLEELMDVTEKLAAAELAVSEESIDVTPTTAGNSPCSRCKMVMMELEQKNGDLHQERSHAHGLELQVAELADENEKNEADKTKLRHEVQRLEAQIDVVREISFVGKECEIQKLLQKFSSQNILHLEKQLLVNDSELARLKQELRHQQEATHGLQEKIFSLEDGLAKAQHKIRKLSKEQGKQLSLSQAWQPQLAPDVPDSFRWSNFRLPGLISVSTVVILCIIKR